MKIRSSAVFTGLALVALVASACSSSGGSSTTSSAARSTSTTLPQPEPVLFSPENNNLWAYGLQPGPDGKFAAQKVDAQHSDDPKGWDINGEICSLSEGRIISGEDTGQPNPPAGWGVFIVHGDRVGNLSVKRVARLVPTFMPDDSYPDTYGCGVLSDGRVVTTVIGNNASGPADGQLVMWYPPFDSPDGSGITYCKLDVGIATAQQIWIGLHDDIYVASARPPTSGIWKYTGPFPTSADAKGGCGKTDPTGSPLANHVTKTRFITPSTANSLISPNGVVGSADGTIYVSSIINGVIAAFDSKGTFERVVLQPPAGEKLGAKPYSTGTPLGLRLGPDGSLYYADLGLVKLPGKVPDTGSKAGSVRVIRFVDGTPQPPQTIASGLTFPDGLGFWSAQ
jgi:hypothetical protein